MYLKFISGSNTLGMSAMTSTTVKHSKNKKITKNDLKILGFCEKNIFFFISIGGGMLGIIVSNESLMYCQDVVKFLSRSEHI